MYSRYSLHFGLVSTLHLFSQDRITFEYIIFYIYIYICLQSTLGEKTSLSIHKLTVLLAP